MIEKISKICWNDNNWARPSGTNGKSASSEAYENAEGFGHEEWLLDKSKIVNGCHYAFLQPLNLKTDRHVGQVYKIWLYTITSKQKFLIGYIDNAICISKEESVEICKVYKQKGWLKDMARELESAGINPIRLKETPLSIFFNVKFRVKDIKLYDDFPVIADDDRNLTTTRYKLLNKVSEFKFEGTRQKGTESYLRKAGAEIFVDPYHNKLQNALSKCLKKSGHFRNIKIETDYVDVQATFYDGTVHFFEIKTDTPKNNVRQAIGQLLEYSMYPNKQLSQKLIIVGDAEPSQEVKKYLRHLRATTDLNLFYQWIDMDNSRLSACF